MLEMFSREGECVPLAAPVEARGNVEAWLQRLVEGMQVGGCGDSCGGHGMQACVCVCGYVAGLELPAQPGSETSQRGNSTDTACLSSVARQS